MDQIIKYKVEFHDDQGTLCDFSFDTEDEALQYVEVVKPHSFWPDQIEVVKVGISYSETSTTDYDDLSRSPWRYDWGRNIWWDGVDNPTHLRKERTND